MSAFDDTPRSALGPAGHTDARFSYLNSSARPEAAAVRKLIDAWLSDYPAQHRDALIGRLRGTDTDHLSAFFELTLHALLLRQGCTVPEVEPVRSNGRAPDFEVAAPDGRRFILEAKLVEGKSKAKAGAESRMNDLLKAIDEVNSPCFFLDVHERGKPEAPLPLRQWQREIQAFVDGLDYQKALADRAAGRQLPLWPKSEGGFTLRITAVPKNRPKPGGRAIGGSVLPGGFIRPEETIRAAIKDKARRYGDLDLPFVVAVNALPIPIHVDDAVEALFGGDEWAEDAEGRWHQRKARDGLWQRPKGPARTVSAVLFIQGLTPWKVAQRGFTLITNPWARHPLGDVDLGTARIDGREGQLVNTPGPGLAQIFGLPDDWPA